jgi:predicted membrane GTPase involved in stress response
MYDRFPLEQMCSHSEQPFQLVFARNARDILRTGPDCHLEATGRGLLILGETEAAVSHPVSILKSTYGDRLSVGKLTIRYRNGAVLEEPYMRVRVSCPFRYAHAVRSNLDARGAEAISTEDERSCAVIKATAPLASLLGYSDFITHLTEGRGRVAMSFSHYAPVPDPPSGTAA